MLVGAGLTLPRDDVLFFLLFKADEVAGLEGWEFIRPTFVPGAAAAAGAAGGSAELVPPSPNELPTPLKKSILIYHLIIF